MASIDAVRYTGTTSWQQVLRNAVRTLDQNHHDLAMLLDKMNHLNDDQDFTGIESEFGIATGDGDNARNELAAYLAKALTDDTTDHVDAARKQLIAKLL